ncbi:MAG: phage terminase large subunit [Bacteroidales bacterium]|nr:phage terminase large subunit [Bacteroidales bacterium]
MLNANEVHAKTLQRWGGDILSFTSALFPLVNGVKFDINEHTLAIAQKLNGVLSDDPNQPKHIIINMPPRSGKTELCILYFVALGFAVNPASVFMHLSSSDNLVNINVGSIRKIMLSDPYKILFPLTSIANNAAGSIATTAGGTMYAAPFLGQITGFGCGTYGSKRFSGALLVDDPVKTQDALSETMRERVNFTWANTIISRRNSENTPVIIIAQRTHVHDLCGFLLEEEGRISEGGKWDLLELPAIIDEGTSQERSYWPSRISLESLKKQKELNPWVFDTQYMQNPKPVEGLLFNEKETRYFDDTDMEGGYILLQCDPADEGTNKTCSAVYCVKGEDVYVMDVIYSAMNTEHTIPRIIEQMKQWKVRQARIESNAAWSLFRKEIKRLAAEQGITTEILAVSQRQNKELRIFNQAPSIQKYFLYRKPSMQNDEYRVYMREKHSYLKLVKDQKDDGVDTDTAACEYLKRMGMIPTI